MAKLNSDKTVDWFENWFDTPYYNLLYKNRDEEEAYAFINRLIDHLEPDSGSKMLDLACGNGRHSKFLAEKGFEVVGVDLAEQQIKKAKTFESDSLRFYRHDMREPFPECGFDYIFNFFTSFGYFSDEEENQSTLKNVAACLKKSGKFLIDFMNVERVIRKLVPEETKHVNGVSFDIKRYYEAPDIIKEIKVKDNSEELTFHERVRAIGKQDFIKYLSSAGLEVKEIFGDYHLNSFDESSSERLIILAEK